MKKILIAGSMLAALSTSALAEHFYIRVDGGASFRDKMHSTTDTNQVFNYLNQKASSKTLGQFGLGFGGYLADNVRADLNFTYFLNANYTTSAITLENINTLTTGLGSDAVRALKTLGFGPELSKDAALKPFLNVDSIINTATIVAAAQGTAALPGAATDLDKLKLEAILASGQTQIAGLKLGDIQVKSFSIMPRLYYDFWNFGAGNMFFGVGLGYANASASADLTATVNTNPVFAFTPAVAAKAAVAAVAADPAANPPVVAVAAVAAVPAVDAFYKVTKAATPGITLPAVTVSTKTTNNFAWSAHLGFDYKIESMEGVKLNAEYYYSDMGKLGQWTSSNLTADSNLHLRSHNLTLGLRFDM